MNEDINQKSAFLYEQIVDFAGKKVELERVREDREASAERVSDAARAFRAIESNVFKTLGELVELHAKELRQT